MYYAHELAPNVFDIFYRTPCDKTVKVARVFNDNIEILVTWSSPLQTAKTIKKVMELIDTLFD